MASTTGLRKWLRDRAVQKARDAGVLPGHPRMAKPRKPSQGKRGKQELTYEIHTFEMEPTKQEPNRPCPSCGLRHGHAYFCAIAHPD